MWCTRWNPSQVQLGQVSSQQLKAASKNINAELERRAKRAKWQVNVSKQVVSTIWPKNYLLNIWFPSWAVTEYHFVSNLIITVGVQAIVDQEVCFSPIYLLLVRFDPLLSLLGGGWCGSGTSDAMQCNSCLHMSVSKFQWLSKFHDMSVSFT